MTGIFQNFIFCHIFLTSDSIHLYMYKACLELTHLAAEELPYSVLILPGHEALVDAVLVFPIYLDFRDARYLIQDSLRFRAYFFNS